jgi:tetratricopeptide (TPR) repeat protein
VGDRRNEAYILSQSSSAYLRQGLAAAALVESKAALALIREIGDRRLEAMVLQLNADAHAALGQVQEADGGYAEALALLDKLGCEGEAARVRWAYGLFLHAQGASGPGLALMERCVAYEQAIGHPQAAEHAACLVRLREATEQSLRCR